MTTTSITKHLENLPELMTFKVQWNGETFEQDFESIMIRCDEDKIDISRNNYDDDSDHESFGFYSAPEFTCSDEKMNKVNNYFKANDYPFEMDYYTMSPELIFIHGFDNLFGSDKVIPLETIIDDVLAILLSEDEIKDE